MRNELEQRALNGSGASERRDRRLGGLIAVCVLPIAVSGLLSGCGGEEPTPQEPGQVPVEVQTAREIAAAKFADERFDEAREALAPLLARKPVDPEDYLRAAVVELAEENRERAEELLNEAAAESKSSPRYFYLRGMLARAEGRTEEAVEGFRRARQLAADDYPTHLMLAIALEENGDEAAEEHLRRLIAKGPAFGGSFYVSAVYRLGRWLMQEGEIEEARSLLDEHSRLQAQGITSASDQAVERGTLGRLEFPRPSKAIWQEPVSPGPFRASVEIAPLPAPVQTLASVDLSADWRIVEENGGFASSSIGATDLLVVVAGRIEALRSEEEGTWSRETLAEVRGVELVRWFDLGKDGSLDLWVVAEDGLSLLVEQQGEWVRSSTVLPEIAGAPTDLEVVDYDHDGDLDVLLVGDFGFKLWRNDGVAQGGSFSDATAGAGLPAGNDYAWAVVDDFDTDQDVDLLMGGAGGTMLADNLRNGRFSDETARLPVDADLSRQPVVLDVDADSRPDLWTGDAAGTVLHGTAGGAFRLETAVAGAASTGGFEPLDIVDLNLDGEADLIGLRPDGGVGAILSVGSPHSRLENVAEATEGAPTTVTGFASSARESPDVVVGAGDRIRLHSATGARGNALRLALMGTKDNQRGVGAIVEVRAGPKYQRWFWDGEPRLVGLGESSRAEWIRVTWPNGVVQSLLDVPAGEDRVIEQVEGLVGSCPFLYAWNGETYTFVTDVLGITPLGLPIAAGRLVPPDHDEYVLIGGDQLVPRDGRYEVQLTEELREVTYLDQVRLEVVDHPQGTEIYPNERFTFPPFPEARIHAFSSAVAPRRAVDGDGRVWTEALAATDMEFAVPFDAYDSSGGESMGQYLGLAPFHSLEIEFDDSVLVDREHLRLVLTGWFYWTDASVNMASSRTPGIEFVPPILQVPDGDGGWVDTGPPVGFPAGKLKTMVLDVSDILDPSDPRLRLVSTLRLYWDSIRLALDGDDVPLRITSLPAAVARLWERGFSEPYDVSRGLQLTWFDWDRTTAQPRWNQHPGLYTRLGEVGELLAEIDDRFVIMGSGDALTVTFDATQVPTLPEGWQRDYLLFLDGWAKDRDPNTLAAETVEPLPFHGMSGYPYGPDEAFPDDTEHLAWRVEWLTRPARRWIEPLHEMADNAVAKVAPADSR